MVKADTAQQIRELFASASQQHRSGQLYDASRLYRRILEMDAHHADALHLLGVVALQRGLHDEAIGLIGRAISENDKVPAFHTNLGNALRARGELPQAVLAFQRSLALREDAPDTLYNLAVVLQELGRLDEAAAAYRRVIHAKPDHPAARSNLGNVLNVQGSHVQALACFDEALRIQPDFLPALVNRGNVLKAQGRAGEAVHDYRRALQLNPRFAAAHNNLGLALVEMNQWDAALAAFEHALSIEPRYVEAHRNRANALRESGRTVESVAGYRQALSIEPDNAQTRLGLAMASIPVFVESVGESHAATPAFHQALTDLARWNAAVPGRLAAVVGSTQPFYLAYRPTTMVEPLSRYGDLVCEAAASHWDTGGCERVAARPAADRVRMVVVSGQVHEQHPVWEILLRGILEHLNRDRFEVFLYHTGPRADDETLWARARVDRFVQGPKPLPAWVAQLREDRPEIIFYPEVGMDPVTCALAAIRQAPLQVASWGHPVTTGLPTIDLYLSGELLEAPEADAHYRERLVRLPGTGACTRAPRTAARNWEPVQSRSGGVRFALPHQPIKFDPQDDLLLTRIAKAVGPCEFWLAAPARLGWATERLRARLARVFRAEHLDPDAYLRVTPWLPPDEFRGFLDAMDVYLDCAAFSGYTTAWQAVHRGLPVVALEGEFLRQRLAAGLMRQLGTSEGVATSTEDYVKRAAQFAAESRDPERRASRRARIREAAHGASDHHGVIAALERALLGAVGALRCGG